MRLSATLSAVLVCLLGCPWLMNGQTQSSAASSTQRHYADQAYLSPTRYANEFFGFYFDYPAEARLEPIPQAVANDGRIQLLQLGGPPPTDAAVSVVALPPAGIGPLDAKTVLRRSLDQELYRGVEELRGLSKTMLGGHQFYFYETRRGIEQHMRAAGSLNGYVVIVQLSAHNEKTLKDMESSFQQIGFFAPGQISQYLTADARVYEGPAISSHRLAEIEADPPQAHIDPGKLEGGVYHNPALGLTYQVPPGWIVEAEGAILPAIERARANETWAGLLDGETPNNGAAERQLMKACSRTLFSVWAKRPGPHGQISYDDFGEVTLSAISAGCFPAVRFPSNSTDKQALQDFLLLLGLTHPILRDMRDAKAFNSQGAVFLLLHGTIGFKVPDDELSRRLSVAMAITQRRGYLLTWFFAAPHDSELQQLLKDRVGFDPDVANKDKDVGNEGSKPATMEAAKPAGGSVTSTATPTSSPATASASSSGNLSSVPGGGSTVNNNQVSTSASGPNGASNSSASDGSQQDNPASASQTTRPTLLRPGETMEGQQGNGAAVPKH